MIIFKRPAHLYDQQAGGADHNDNVNNNNNEKEEKKEVEKDGKKMENCRGWDGRARRLCKRSLALADLKILNFWKIKKYQISPFRTHLVLHSINTSNTLYENANFLENTKFSLLKQTLFDIPGEKFIGVGLDVTATSGKQLFPKKTKSFTSIRDIHNLYCHKNE